jgi:hypothetical protein
MKYTKSEISEIARQNVNERVVKQKAISTLYIKRKLAKQDRSKGIAEITGLSLKVSLSGNF